MPGRSFNHWQVGDRVAFAITRTVTKTDNVLVGTLTKVLQLRGQMVCQCVPA